MNFTGNWINKEDNKRVRFTGPMGGDLYLLEYRHKKINRRHREKVTIQLKDKKQAILVKSERFGSTAIKIINSNCIEIGNEVFERSDIEL